MLFLVFAVICCSILYANFISVGQFYLALLLFFIFTCVNVLLIYIFLYVFKIGVGGVFLGSAIARVIMIIAYSLIYSLAIDWRDCAENIKKEMERGEKDIKKDELEGKND